MEHWLDAAREERAGGGEGGSAKELRALAFQIAKRVWAEHSLQLDDISLE